MRRNSSRRIAPRHDGACEPGAIENPRQDGPQSGTQSCIGLSFINTMMHGCCSKSGHGRIVRSLRRADEGRAAVSEAAEGSGQSVFDTGVGAGVAAEKPACVKRDDTESMLRSMGDLLGGDRRDRAGHNRQLVDSPEKRRRYNRRQPAFALEVGNQRIFHAL